MESRFYSNNTDTKFIDKLKVSLDSCQAFAFSVSFIKKPGLRLLAPNIEAALARGARGRLITSTYQNFTDVDSLTYFYGLQCKYAGAFECHLDKECFHDRGGNTVGFHSKGYLFEYADHNELLVGSSNITVYALLKNIEWDVSVIDTPESETYQDAAAEFTCLWSKTEPLTSELIDEYRTRLYYAIERWDMDYDIANSEIKPNYMQRRALKELNRVRVMGADKALVVASAGSGKTFLAAFDVLNFDPGRMLYIVHEGSILMKSMETFQRVFGSDATYGIYNAEYKEFDKKFVFSTNVTMANSLELFDRHAFDYIIIDECHHATADTYRRILEYFEPEFLLGITATPERMDGGDVFSMFGDNVPYELRLRDAIVNRLVVPFHYYGIRDELIEYGIKETKGHKFVEQFSDEKHCDFIRDMIEAHRIPGHKLKALAFCRDISHAIRMADAMADHYTTRYLTGKNSTGERVRAYKDLQDDSSDLEILFTVDILNEGVDIPGVNMVLFLRPTESQTIFIQQLGRGLRNYEGKQYVPVLDFIGNDYRRSVQIAFALGGLAENFVVEKQLVAALVNDNFRSVGLEQYGVEIHIDELSKKEILSYIEGENFNTKRYLRQDYLNFKKYISAESYPRHVDYLNNDYAPDLIRFMQSKLSFEGKPRKNSSYYGFLKAIEEELPSFDERQEQFVNYVSEMLPIVRPYEYLIIECLLGRAGVASLDDIVHHVRVNITEFDQDALEHAVRYMMRSGFFGQNADGMLVLRDVRLDVELSAYLQDLVEYGLGQYDIDYGDHESNGRFKLWSRYRKEQVQQLLLNNPADIMKGTKIYDGVVYAYVTVNKKGVAESLDYDDGYIDRSTFQWESEANIGGNALEALKNSERMELFVRKVAEEDGIRLPFTYIGSGHMEFIEGSRKTNGAYLFRVPMETEAPEDLYFDFKLRER